MTRTFCTYLTFYKGNRLPPFYLGFSYVEKIEKGYHGSVCSKQYREIWTDELAKNPHLFETKVLTIHQTSKEAKEKEMYFQRKLKVITNPLYTNKSIYPQVDRTGMSSWCAGTKGVVKAWNKGLTKETNLSVKKYSDAGAAHRRGKTWEEIFGIEKANEMRESARERRTEMNKTNPSGMKGKKHSEETKEKMRKPKKNLENYKGRKWFHDPITKEQKWIYPSSVPTGWVKGRKNNDCR